MHFLVVQMENKQQQCSTQLIFIIAYLNTANVHILLRAGFSAMGYTRNCVSKCRFFFIFKHSPGPGKLFIGVLEKSWIFVVKEWETWHKKMWLSAALLLTLVLTLDSS